MAGLDEEGGIGVMGHGKAGPAVGGDNLYSIAGEDCGFLDRRIEHALHTTV
jgi:hypothetical protein